MLNDKYIKPTMILPKGQVSREDIDKLNENGLCVVEAEDPSLVRFMEPPPEGYSLRELSAIQLFRVVMASRGNTNWSRMELATKFAEILIEGKYPAGPEPIASAKKG